MNTPAAKSASLTARTFWLIFAKMFSFAFGIALPLLLVRRLSQVEFGLYKQAFLIVGTAASILPLGFSMSAYYFLPRESENKGAIVLNILLFNLVVGSLAFLTLLLKPGLIEIIFNSRELVPYAPLIGLLIFCGSCLISSKSPPWLIRRLAFRRFSLLGLR